MADSDTTINGEGSKCDCLHCTAWKWRVKVLADRVVQIQRCTDPHMWYVDRVGQLISIERVTVDGLWAREPAGYINIIKFEDVEPETKK